MAPASLTVLTPASATARMERAVVGAAVPNFEASGSITSACDAVGRCSGSVASIARSSPVTGFAAGICALRDSIIA